ncbi:MAG: HlyD family efflux transporter periplasmic adaptor subunit, partial [Planctomycetota bacterium]|nr:HlyD family efflux transporter periplasmic adaptor subunit [Planctomycetota bacterium]
RDVDRAKILAPFAGCVRSESVSDGQLVARGQVLADLFSSDLAEVRVPLVDGDLAYLDLPGYGRFEGGPSATITTMFAGAARSWTGRVLGMEGEVDGTSRMVTLIVGVEDPYGAAAAATGAPLMPGLFVDVALTGRAVEEAILLPRDALRAGSLVFVVDSKGVLRFRKVTLGWRDEQRVQILTGLAAGDGVCLSPLAAPVDGMRVRVVLPDGSVREPEPAPAAEAPGSETPGADAEAAGHSSQPSPNGGSQ